MKLLSIPCILLLALLFSCADNTTAPIIDDGNNGGGGNGGGTVNVYQRDIQPIFTGNCAGSACHVGGSSNNIRLGSYANVMASNGNALGPLVIPNDADGSPLVQILQSSQQGIARMPLGGSALSTSDINKIKAWINAGAKNE